MARRDRYRKSVDMNLNNNHTVSSMFYAGVANWGYKYMDNCSCRFDIGWPKGRCRVGEIFEMILMVESRRKERY